MADPTMDQDPYEAARQRAAARNNAAVQNQRDAIQRRFAALGSVNSGAAIKQGQLAEQAGQENLANETQQINAAQAAEKRQLAEAEKGRQFSREERLGSEAFQGGQNALQRQFQTGERLGGQEFSAQQAGLQRDFASNESRLAREQAQKQFDADMALKWDTAANAKGQWQQQMDLANKQYVDDKETTEFNKWIQRQQLEQNQDQASQGIVGSLSGGRGIRGLVKDVAPIFAPGVDRIL